MKKYIGYEYNEAGELIPAYAYTITPEELETIENLIGYYNRFSVEDLITRRPGFVIEDFTKILETLEDITNEEA